MKDRIKSKNKICIILIAILLIFTTNVYAVDSFKTSLNADKSSVKRGENITVTIALSDIAIESGEKGIGAYTANIDFNSSVLEYVSASGTDKWEILYQDKAIIGNTEDGEVVNTAQNIGTITFKVKEDAELGETTIRLINFSGSNAESDISGESSSIVITVTDENGGTGNGSGTGDTGTGNENNPGNGNNNGNGTGSGSNNGNGSNAGSGNENQEGSIGGNGNTQNGGTNGNKNTGNGEKNNIKKGSLPATGGNSNITKYVLIGIFVLVAIIFCFRMKSSYNRKNK